MRTCMTNVSCVLFDYTVSLPGPPDNFTLIQVTDTVAVVDWDPPKENAIKVVNYEVRYREMTSSAFKTVSRQMDNVIYIYIHTFLF